MSEDPTPRPRETEDELERQLEELERGPVIPSTANQWAEFAGPLPPWMGYELQHVDELPSQGGGMDE